MRVEPLEKCSLDIRWFPVQLEAIVAEVLTEALRHGFFGTAAIELSVQDGTIQHIRRKVERIEK